MRKQARFAFLAVAMASLVGALGACASEGPMERAGRKIDRAGDKVEDAAKDVRDDLR